MATRVFITGGTLDPVRVLSYDTDAIIRKTPYEVTETCAACKQVVSKVVLLTVDEWWAKAAPHGRT